ncbi:Inosine-5'-monophosphate dehydrogenase [Piscirickettsia salmonis]|uniref:CBS domain-containing protein n=1 Tax=Piscirickettsia salmonis TaxID=1238 RepID=UPI0012BA90C2|nr:CBS domain-containing protein [Piscirickettsia salmonis]QGP56577.1 Inosine-5'-monophosphate dehydrogenase [Piscirickettsia salmonis]QGP61385.1 Inosine-5'-monophosphate dehydrogenase [Piscirickettsia salmonis]QGP66143.1 Inosine-5'-monophosphate dehydrogenase [Piscirickettsia salmonis]
MKHSIPISKIMNTDLITVNENNKFSELRSIMEKNRINHLPVMENRKITGIISYKDVLKTSFSDRYANQQESDQLLDYSMTITDFMTKELFTIKETDTVKHATQMLVEKKFNALPVVDNNANLVGIITLHDLLIFLLDQY